MAGYTQHEQYSIYGRGRRASPGQISMASMKWESKNSTVLWECTLYADKQNFLCFFLFFVVDSVTYFTDIFRIFFLGRAFHNNNSCFYSVNNIKGQKCWRYSDLKRINDIIIVLGPLSEFGLLITTMNS